MSVNVNSDRTSSGRGTRALLLGSVGLFAVGAVVAQAASVSSKRPGVSAFISTSLAALIAAKTPAPVPTPTPTPPTAGADSFKLGMNLTGIEYYNDDRPFMNLIYGSNWELAMPGQAWRALPDEYLDANRWVKAIPAGGTVVRMLNHPVVPASGLEITCRWEGDGRISVNGRLADIRYSANSVSFRLTSRHPDAAYTSIFYGTVNAADPIRNIDCRETGANRQQVFDPAFVDGLQPYKIIRFMGWQDTNSNNTVTWQTRNRPGGGEMLRIDAVPMEHLVELTRQTSADPWFNMPWNADDEYIRKFAEYARDNVPRDRKIYVETSNEVWNAIFKVAGQAFQEGWARQLSTDRFSSQLHRYSERTVEVMRIWTEVFSGQMHRLVRVAATQHSNPWTSQVVLEYRDTANWVDALATAPYFGHDVDVATLRGDQTAVFARLQNDIRSTMVTSLKQKAIATSFGKRFLSYEAGIHTLAPNDVPNLRRLNQDPRMYNTYLEYMNAWRSQIGDALMLFASTGPVGAHGAWGLIEYIGQPENEAPKRRAVLAIAASGS